MAVAPSGRGRNSVRLRRYNERFLLQVLRRGGEASKAELARRTHLTSTAIGGIIQSLEQSELIAYTGRTEGQRGQPATLIDLNPKGAFGIGVRLDRDSIETALLDFGGQILARRVHEGTLPAPREALRLVQEDIEAVLATITADERDRLTGIGVAQPFNLGAWLRELDIAKPEFQAWDEVDFPFELGEATGLPVFSENDGNAAAIAELFYGRGREFDDFLYVFMGPVIGCGVALDGDCLRGVSGNAGHIAVMPVPHGTLASAHPLAGRWAPLLSRASLNALQRHLRHAGVQVASHADIEQHVLAHHPAVEEWVADCVDALAPALLSALCILDVPVVVFDADVDGGLVEQLLRGLDEALAEIAPEAWEPPALVRGSFGADAGAVGAASLPMFFTFSPRAELLRASGKSKEEITNGQ